MAQRTIKITAGGQTALADMHETPSADAIWAALPIFAPANTWGDEIYFSIPVKSAPEPGALEVVQEGDLAYWPPGSAFCIFFGPTPASIGNEIRPASAVNVFGRVRGDAKIFKTVPHGGPVKIERA